MIKMKKILSFTVAIAILVTTLPTVALPVGAVSAPTSKAVSEETVTEETVTEETVSQATALVERASTKAANSGTIGECTWYILGNTLTISGNGAMGDRHGFYIPWKNETSSIYRVVVEEGVTSIGSYAFSGCSNL
ncbi:MAG: hypothetical protein IJB11_06885, partial [Oscillospiraceae bacterium]|nr:hypothetical protein [Oscillospiraceae bacterium]